MAMGKRKRDRQRDLWISFGEMAQAPGHPFYERVNKVGIVTLTGCRGTKPPYRVLRRGFTADILGLFQLVMR